MWAREVIGLEPDPEPVICSFPAGTRILAVEDAWAALHTAVMALSREEIEFLSQPYLKGIADRLHDNKDVLDGKVAKGYANKSYPLPGKGISDKVYGGKAYGGNGYGGNGYGGNGYGGNGNGYGGKGRGGKGSASSSSNGKGYSARASSASLSCTMFNETHGK